MAKKPKNTETIVESPDTAFVPAPAPHGYDLSLRLPVWSHDLEVPIRCELLGEVNLPSKQPNQKHWTCYLVLLTAATKVTDQDDEGHDIVRVARAGERVLVTKTAALKRFEGAASDPHKVFEVYLKPAGTEQTKAGTEVKVFRPMIVVGATHRVPEKCIPSSPLPEAKTLPFEASSNDEIN